MGMGVRHLLRPHDVGMGVDPENREVITIALVQIGERSETDVAVAAEGHDRFRRMALDRGAGRCNLLKEDVTGCDPILNRAVVACRCGNRHGFHRPLRIRGDGGEHTAADAVARAIAALPLRQFSRKTFFGSIANVHIPFVMRVRPRIVRIVGITFGVAAVCPPSPPIAQKPVQSSVGRLKW